MHAHKVEALWTLETLVSAHVCLLKHVDLDVEAKLAIGCASASTGIRTYTYAWRLEPLLTSVVSCACFNVLQLAIDMRLCCSWQLTCACVAAGN
jgi:hypothetical protein